MVYSSNNGCIIDRLAHKVPFTIEDFPNSSKKLLLAVSIRVTFQPLGLHMRHGFLFEDCSLHRSVLETAILVQISRLLKLDQDDN